jgi:hypothetical protein
MGLGRSFELFELVGNGFRLEDPREAGRRVALDIDIACQ